MVPKAYRWVAEMEEIAQFLGGEDQGAAIYLGAARLYGKIAREFAADDSGEVLAALLAFCKLTRK